MHSRLLMAVTGRVTLALINLIILVVGVNSIIDMLPMLANFSNDIPVLENITEGFATILIAYGVAAEERSTLMHFLRLYPGKYSPLQDALDKICHHYGLLLLLLGLFIELCEELVKMPDSIVSTNGIESCMFYIAVVLTGVTSCVLLRFTWLLVFPPPSIVESVEPK